MSFIEERLLKETIVYALETALTTSGDAQYGSTQTARARVEHYQTVVRGVEEENLLSSHRAVVAVELPVRTRVWLDGVDTTAANALTVIESKGGRSLRGSACYEVLLR